MSNSDLSPAAPQGGKRPPQIKPVWCPRAGGSAQTGSPAGHCNHPLSRSSQTLLCHRISKWMVKLVGWGLCTPFSLSTSLAHGFFLFMLCHVFNVEEEVVIIRNGWSPKKRRSIISMFDKSKKLYPNHNGVFQQRRTRIDTQRIMCRAIGWQQRWRRR